MKRESNHQKIAWFWDLKNRERLILDPPYQRKSVWNQEYKDFFIDTVLNNYPAPAIFLYEEIDENGYPTYSVVDGKQRLTTVFEFLENAFPINIRKQFNTAVPRDLDGKLFSELSKEVKDQIFTYIFTVEYVPSNRIQEINEIFDRINRNVRQLTKQELRHARFEGVFIKSVENMNDYMQTVLPNDFPHVAETKLTQMKDVEQVSELMLAIDENTIPDYTPDVLDVKFSERDEEWGEKDDVERKFKKIIDYIGQLVKYDDGYLASSRLRNVGDFYSFFIALYEIDKERHALESLNMEAVYSNLKTFFDFYKNLSREEQQNHPNELISVYYANVVSAAKSKARITKRKDIVIHIILEGFRNE